MNDIKNFSDKTRPKNYKKIKIKKKEKEIASDNLYKFYIAKEMVPNGFKTKIFSIKFKGTGILNADRSKLKILTSKQVLQKLPIALAQVKASNNSENLLNEMTQLFILCIS